MAETITPFNHTTRLFMNGSNAVGDTYKLILYSALTFDATQTTLAGLTGTEVTNANGYTTGGLTLTNVTVTTVNTNGAKFDADDAIWSATGSGISAVKGIIYNDTDSGDPPLWYINFDGTKIATAGNDFKVIWPANGIATLGVV